MIGKQVLKVVGVVTLCRMLQPFSVWDVIYRNRMSIKVSAVSCEQAESKCMLYFQHGLLPTTRSMFHVHLKAIFVCDLLNPTCRVDSIGAQTRISYGWKPVGYLKLSLENLLWKFPRGKKTIANMGEKHALVSVLWCWPSLVPIWRLLAEAVVFGCHTCCFGASSMGYVPWRCGPRPIPGHVCYYDGPFSFPAYLHIWDEYPHWLLFCRAAEATNQCCLLPKMGEGTMPTSIRSYPTEALDLFRCWARAVKIRRSRMDIKQNH